MHEFRFTQAEILTLEDMTGTILYPADIRRLEAMVLEQINDPDLNT